MALDTFRTGKAYTVAEAAQIAETSPQTVRRWLRGYEHPEHHMDPVFGKRQEEKELSFLQLAEIKVVAGFRKHNIKLSRVREAYALLKDELQVEFPFATQTMESLGGHILHRFDESHSKYRGQTLAISVGRGQYVLPAFVTEALEQLEFSAKDGIATRLYPGGKGSRIVLDPHFAGGRLAILHRGVTVAGIVSRFRDGKQSIGFIASDLDLKPNEVEVALRLAKAA